MKLVHLSDLHIGKIIERTRMLEDQEYILKQLVCAVKDELPDAVLISGDVYDRGVPPSEAVVMLDRFIVELSEIKLSDGRPMQTFIVSGNHDSPERLAFGNLLMTKNGIHISPVYNGTVEPFVLHDEFGEVCVYMLPFIKPVHVRDALTDMGAEQSEIDSVETYTDAVAKAVELMNVDETKRNVILSHQFVSGGAVNGSETVSVGGLDVVDISVYDKFNYVALGHLHTAQRLTTAKGDRNVVCYCGSPLKYSFSEKTEKSVAVVEIDGQGVCTLRQRPLVPLRDMRTIEASFSEISEKGESSSDYIRVILTDDELPAHTFYELRRLFPNLLQAMPKHVKRLEDSELLGSDITAEQSALDVFSQFFTIMHDRELDERERALISKLLERAEENLLLGEKNEKTEVNGNAAD